MTRRAFVVATCLIVLATAVPSAGAQSSGADLALKMVGPGTTPLVGDVFDLDLTVTNLGPDSAEQAFLSSYLPPELELRSVVAADPAASCSEDGGYPETEPQPAEEEGSTGGGSSPGYHGGGISCDLGTLGSGVSSAIKLTLQRVGARETFSSSSVSSSVEDPNYDNNYQELLLEPDRSNPSDVGVTVSGPRAPDVGATFRYTITVVNNGPSTAENVVLTDSGGGVRLDASSSSDPTDSCEKTFDDPSYGYFELRCDLGSLAPAATAIVTLTAERTSAWEIYNWAFVTTANFDENYDNDYADHSIPADPSVTSDLALRAQGPAHTPLVGETFKVTFTATNAGPSSAGDVWVSGHLTDGLEFVSVEPADKCSYNSYEHHPYAEGATSAPAGKEGDSYYPMSSDGVYCGLGSLASGSSATIELTLTRTKGRELWNSAWISSSNYDPNYDNNYSDLRLDPDKSNPADLRAGISAPHNPAVGSDFDIVMSVQNQGPSQAEDVSLSSYLPWGLGFKTVAPEGCTFSGSGDPEPLAAEESRPSYYGGGDILCEFGAVPAGETRSATLTVTRVTEYEIWTSAWTGGANYDPDYENDHASILIEGEPYAGACPADGSTIEGTKGSDSIVVGDCGTDTKGGADSVEAAPSSGGGDTIIRTGRGSDNISVVLNSSGSERRRIVVEAGRGPDTLTLTAAPGAGNATVILKGNGGDDNIVLNLSPGAEGLRIVARGNGGNDVLQGGSKGEVSDAMPRIRGYGGEGSDVLEGGDGNDLLFGGAGGDRLFGGLGDDELDGGRGRDECRGGPGRDSSYRC